METSPAKEIIRAETELVGRDIRKLREEMSKMEVPFHLKLKSCRAKSFFLQEELEVIKRMEKESPLPESDKKLIVLIDSDTGNIEKPKISPPRIVEGRQPAHFEISMETGGK